MNWWGQQTLEALELPHPRDWPMHNLKTGICHGPYLQTNLTDPMQVCKYARMLVCKWAGIEVASKYVERRFANTKNKRCTQVVSEELDLLRFKVQLFDKYIL